MLESRKEARKNKDWASSDQIRKTIHNEGWLVEDTPDGQKLKKAQLAISMPQNNKNIIP